MTAIGIIGSRGRMGQALVAAIAEAGHDHAGGADQGDNVAALVAASDVLVDFSSPKALQATLDACVAEGKPIVIGTTGLEAAHHAAIDQAEALLSELWATDITDMSMIAVASRQIRTMVDGASN